MKRLLLIVLPLLLIVGCSSPEPINYEETLNERDDVYYTKDTNQPYSGPVFSLDDNGRNKRESILEDGKMISHKDFEWYENGQKKWEVTFKDGKENGLRTYFGNDGKEYKGIFVGKKNEDLIETKMENGTFNGSVFEKRDGYVLGLTNFKDGKKELYTEWYENGQRMRETSYKDGKYDERHGVIVYDETTTRWFENGKIQFEGTFKDGVRDGLQTWWYENGQKFKEGTFKDGDGLETWWYENGQKESEVTYKDGVRDGLQTWWYENRTKKMEGTFKDGNMILSKYWNEDGSLKE